MYVGRVVSFHNHQTLHAVGHGCVLMEHDDEVFTIKTNDMTNNRVNSKCGLSMLLAVLSSSVVYTL